MQPPCGGIAGLYSQGKTCVFVCQSWGFGDAQSNGVNRSEACWPQCDAQVVFEGGEGCCVGDEETVGEVVDGRHGQAGVPGQRALGKSLLGKRCEECGSDVGDHGDVWGCVSPERSGRPDAAGGQVVRWWLAGPTCHTANCGTFPSLLSERSVITDVRENGRGVLWLGDGAGIGCTRRPSPNQVRVTW